MARSVLITTPRLTWDETVERLGLSKAEQKFVTRLFEESKPRRSASYAFKTRPGSSRLVKSGTRNGSGIARKTRNRASKAA